jgi:hypothetical protein
MPDVMNNCLAIPARPSDEGDPVIALIEERSRLVVEWDAEIDAADAADAEVTERSSDRFYSLIGRLDDQIAGLVATSAAGIIGQVRILREIDGANTFNTDRADDCTDELFSSIAAGIQQLAGIRRP